MNFSEFANFVFVKIDAQPAFPYLLIYLMKLFLNFFFQQKGIEIWARPILPVYRGKYSYAIVFLNRRTDGTPSEVSVTLRELGLDHNDGYHITDLYDNYDYGIVTPERRFKVDVNPSGSK